MYFQAPYTEDNIKKQYRELSKRLHPDKGGTDTEFRLMKFEFDVLQKVISQPKQEIKKRIIIKKSKPRNVNYHFTTDKNTVDLLKSLKKIFK